MMGIGATIGLFLVIFLVINLVAAAPGRPEIRDVVRVGLRHFVMGSVIIIVASAALYFLFNWLISRPPLW